MPMIALTTLVIVTDQPDARTAVKEAVLDAVIASRNGGWNLPDNRLRDSSISVNLPIANDQFRLDMAFYALDPFRRQEA